MLDEMSSKQSETLVIEKTISIQRSILPESKDTIVRNSIPSKTNLVFMENLWEDNRREDWRVMGTWSWLADENVEESIQAIQQSKDTDLGGPDHGSTENIPRVKLADVIEYNGHQRKVHQVSEIVAPSTD
ncbi:hypothetical protein V6N13_122458 [Hibiscus sabdariffa]